MLVAATPLVAACAAMLGIEELPLAARDAGVPDDSAPEPDVPDACDSRDASFCARACPAYDFCDDFESEGPDFYRWQSPAVLPKPFRTGGLGPSLDLVAASADRGTTLVVQAQSKDGTTSGIGLIAFVQKPHNRTPRGIATRLKGQLQEFSFPDRPELEKKRAGVFGVGIAALPVPVAMLTIYEHGATEVDLAVQQRSVGGPDTPFDVLLAKGIPRIALEATFPEVELVVGVRSALAENKYACNLEDAGVDEAGADEAGADADVDSGVQADPMVVYIRSVGLSKCAVLTGLLADPSWLAEPSMFAGASIADYGRIKWAFDDIAARYLY